MVTADEAASAVGTAAQLLARAMSGRSAAGRGAVLWLCGAELAALNGVVAWDAAATAPEVERLLAEAAATGLPHSLQLRPGAPPGVVDVAVRRGMRLVEHTPLMVADGALRAREVVRLEIERLAPEDVARHVALVARGFEMAPDEVARVTTPDVLRTPSIRAYVGRRDGTDVCTAMAVRTGPSVGVLNVATPPEHRRRGYGAALTAAAAADARADGAAWAWLQSSHLGYGAYARLGFRELEAWPFWVTP